MRALVLWASPEHPNLGVAALAAGSEALLRRAFGDDIEVRFHATGGADQPGNDGPVNIFHLMPLLKERLTNEQHLKEWLTGFDLILDTRAGDSFADIYSVKGLAKMTPLNVFARQWKVPVVMGPQTIGPFDTVRGRALARLTLRSADLVMARDAQSADAAQRLGRPVDIVTTDVAFAIPVPERSETHDVLLNPSGLLWAENHHVDSDQYVRLMHDTVDELEAAGRRVSLLAHVAKDRSDTQDNDVTAVDALAGKVSGEIVIPQGLADVRRAVSSARLVIGARMHACLNALSTGTPAIAMAYSRKFAPLLGQVGWPHTLDLRSGTVSASDVLSLVRRQDELDRTVKAVRDRADELMDTAVSALRTAL